jgi:hypothetical protein
MVEPSSSGDDVQVYQSRLKDYGLQHRSWRDGVAAGMHRSAMRSCMAR